MPAEPRMTDRDLELLSAYLDGELTSHERSRLEARLEREPQLQRELKLLRQTVELVRLMPPIRAPRNFTLTPEMVRPPRILFFPATAAFSAMSAVAAVVFIVLGVLLIQREGLFDGGAPVETLASDAVAMAPTLTADPSLSMAVTPMPSPGELPSAKTEVLEADDQAADSAASLLSDATPLPAATVPMPPPSAPQLVPGGGSGGSGGGQAGGDGSGPEVAPPEMFAPPPDSFAQGEGLYDMSQSQSPPPVPTGEAEFGAFAENSDVARSAAPADETAGIMSVPEEETAGGEAAEEAASLMMAAPEEETESVQAFEGPAGIMMAVPEDVTAEAQAQIAQVASPTAITTATPTEEPTATPTTTPTLLPTPTATPAPLIPVPEGSAGVFGVLFVVLGILAFGLFALSQAARRRRG